MCFEFHLVKTKCLTTLRYLWLYIIVLKSFLVYVSDIFSAVTMLTTTNWSLEIFNQCQEISGCVYIPYKVGKWLFVSCILVGFLLVSALFPVFMKSPDRPCSLHMRQGRLGKSSTVEIFPTHSPTSWQITITPYVCLSIFVNLPAISFFLQCPMIVSAFLTTLATQPKLAMILPSSSSLPSRVCDFPPYILIAFYLRFAGWKRLLLADTPRQAINALTLYTVYLVKQENPGAWYDVRKYFKDNSNSTSALTVSSFFTVAVCAGSLLLLIIAGLCYVPLLLHIRGNLKEYCCHIVDKVG